MDTKNLKAYAPQARRDFIAAVTKRAAQFGLYEDRITDVTIEGSSAIIEGRVFTRKQAQQRSQLAKRISELGFNQFINESAFTWVNRLTAIRYMEVNGYLEHGFRILSMPPKKDANGNEVTAKFGEGFEILAHAADVAEHLELDKSNIVEMLLAGDKEEELYREILLGECHQLSKVMPFMFEKLDDATELLLPDNLTKTDSILKALVNNIPETDWQDIEVIGWLYQFYISEHKDAVIGKVVKKEDIPAATQLFTPNWIVKYLVQNSLGRQWLATYPESELKEKMEYYIVPAEQSDDIVEQLKVITPTSIDPESLKVLDPACGSGHILVEVYEVLREIYLERGYRLREIPELILTKNIYGLDIDDRAAQMAAFAVLMKAREDDRRIFERITSNDIKLNIHSLQSTEQLDINQLWSDLDFEGKHQAGSMSGLFEQTQQVVEPSGEYKVYLDLLRYLKTQFIEAKNLGSLIDVNNSYLENLTKLNAKLLEKCNGSDTVSTPAAEKLLPVVEQAIVLASQYDVIVANPPYMGIKGMNSVLKDFAKKAYPNSKSDLFAVFIERSFNLLKEAGFNSMVTMQSWMFLSSYEKMRDNILDNFTIDNMVHMGNGVMKIAFGTNATVFRNIHLGGYKGSFSYCENNDINTDGIPKEFPVQNERLKLASSNDFKKIPGSPIAYYASEKAFSAFKNNNVESEFLAKKGMAIGDNARFLRLWSEIDFSGIEISAKGAEETALRKWYPCLHGGSFRKWSSNKEYVVNWQNDGEEPKNNITERTGDHWSRYIISTKQFFQEGINWSAISSSSFSARYHSQGFAFTSASMASFSNEGDIKYLLQFVNSVVGAYFFRLLSPTLNYGIAELKKFPLIQPSETIKNRIHYINNRLIEISNDDWNQSEVSWDFNKTPLLSIEGSLLSDIFSQIIHKQNQSVSEVHSLEEENNQIFIDLYELSDELDSNVDLKNISLNVNPCYRFGKNALEFELNTRYRSEVISETLSYAIGCMMGRYSLDREGLVYAYVENNGFKNLVADRAYHTFPADDDGIIPLASEAWLFDDDATARFREFVKTVWGEENLQQNLDFVAESLCLNAIKPKKSESALDTIRRYFSTQFYKAHLKTYKKRPIYWLFSSGKEKAFECLVYLHRYNEGTLSRMRTEYVTPLMGKFESQTSILRDERDTASSSEQRRIDKELKSIEKKQAELRTFDEELKHISELKINLDLDDGVKVNYGKFGNLLANVKDVHGKKPEVVK